MVDGFSARLLSGESISLACIRPEPHAFVSYWLRGRVAVEAQTGLTVLLRQLGRSGFRGAVALVAVWLPFSHHRLASRGNVSAVPCPLAFVLALLLVATSMLRGSTHVSISSSACSPIIPQHLHPGHRRTRTLTGMAPSWSWHCRRRVFRCPSAIRHSIYHTLFSSSICYLYVVSMVQGSKPGKYMAN